MNECQDGTHDCDRDMAICLNTEGSYACQCRPGYTGDGKNCSGIYLFIFIFSEYCMELHCMDIHNEKQLLTNGTLWKKEKSIHDDLTNFSIEFHTSEDTRVRHQVRPYSTSSFHQSEKLETKINQLIIVYFLPYWNLFLRDSFS